MKIICGRCSAEVELPAAGEAPQARCPTCGAVFHLPKLAEGEELPHPDTFPGYHIVAIVGFGGMGTVYRAIQLSMEREVALKVLHKRYSHVPRFVERFEREATALAALNHPNIVAVIDRGRVDDTYYFVMEYVRGRTLRYLIRNKQLTVQQAVEIAIQICDALEAAHGCGVVHRDIKPGNILVTPDGLAKVADFGIVHIAGDDKGAERERRTRLGTAKYMAPEQAGTGKVVDHRADIYALGVTLHEMLTGQLPDGVPPSERNPDVPRALDEIVERATREDREERFQSAAEMRDALEAALAKLRSEETSATAVLAPPEGPRCPACGAVLGVADLDCPSCHTRVREPCFRPDCAALNPVGAERCSACNAHLKLLEAERRGELEAALERAKALVAERHFAEAGAELATVEADPHVAFDDLRLRARELRRAARRARLAWAADVAFKSLVAAAAIALSAAVYWLVERTAPPKTRATTRPRTRVATPRPAPTSAKPLPPAPPRLHPRVDPLLEYLLAATGPRWGAVEPETRLAVACDVALVLGDRQPDATVAKSLVANVRAIERGVPPKAGPSRGRLAAALEVLAETTLALLRRDKSLADLMKTLETDFAARRQAAQGSGARLALAARTLQGASAKALARAEIRLGAQEQSLLLGVALDPPTADADLAGVASRVLRAARMLLLRFYGQKSAAREPELMDWAWRRMREGERSRETTVRLACGLEAMLVPLVLEWRGVGGG